MACQAYLWALPLVSYAQWQTQHRDVFGATNYDLVQYLDLPDRLGLITANATTPYILNFIDLSETGPLVVELPPGPTAGGLSDFWQRECGDARRDGPGSGRGRQAPDRAAGKAVPEVDDSYYVHQSSGMNVMFGFRTLDPDPERSRGLGRRRCGSTPSTAASRPADADRLTRWARLVAATSRAAWSTGTGCTRSTSARSSTSGTASIWRCSSNSGIEKGKPFAPDDRLTGILTAATATGELMAKANSFAKRFPGARYWPDRQWDLVLQLDTPPSAATTTTNCSSAPPGSTRRSASPRR